MKNGFTDSLLYLENSEVMTKSLSNDIDSGNEVNSESGEDPIAIFDEEPIVVYFNDPDCNNFAENDGKWVLNENVNYNYSLYFDDVHNPIDMSSLHMPLPMSMARMHVEDDEGSVFIIPSKRDQSSIIFGRV